MNKKFLKIHILAKPGNFSNSLVALLKTIPEVDLDLRNMYQHYAAETGGLDTDLVIIEQVLIEKDLLSNIRSFKRNFPNAKLLLLADHVRYPNLVSSAFTDCVLPKSTSAGEFLLIIKQLTSASNRKEKMTPMSSLNARSPVEAGVAN